jgi:hypothetical protein
MAFSLKRELWKSLLWAAAGVVGTILFFDIDGWGTFVWSWLAPLLVQAIIALILTSLLLAAIRIISGNLFSRCLSRLILLLLLVATAIVALPFASGFDRPLDIYDGIQTAVLAVIWVFLTPPIQRFLKSLQPTGARPATPLYGQSARRSAQSDYVPGPAPSEPESTAYTADRGRYSTLVNLVGSDPDKAERLIEFERGRAPHASREECIQRAIDSLAHDRRW